MAKFFKRPAPKLLATFQPNMSPTRLAFESEGRNKDYPVYEMLDEPEEWRKSIRINRPSVSALQEQNTEVAILINAEGNIASVDEDCEINETVVFTSDNIGTLELAS